MACFEIISLFLPNLGILPHNLIIFNCQLLYIFHHLLYYLYPVPALVNLQFLTPQSLMIHVSDSIVSDKVASSAVSSPLSCSSSLYQYLFSVKSSVLFIFYFYICIFFTLCIYKLVIKKRTGNLLFLPHNICIRIQCSCKIKSPSTTFPQEMNSPFSSYSAAFNIRTILICYSLYYTQYFFRFISIIFPYHIYI